MGAVILGNQSNGRSRGINSRMGKLTWLVLLVLALISTGCDNKVKNKAQFSKGRIALQMGQYNVAIEKLKFYLKENPNGKLASRASFLIAKSYVGQGELEKASTQFEKTIKTYSTSDEAHKSRYKLAMLSLLKGDRGDALSRFQKLADNPSGTLTPEAAAMARYLEKKNGK